MHYIRADLEAESVARTFEYCYDDWAISHVAAKLSKHDIADPENKFPNRRCPCCMSSSMIQWTAADCREAHLNRPESIPKVSQLPEWMTPDGPRDLSIALEPTTTPCNTLLHAEQAKLAINLAPMLSYTWSIEVELTPPGGRFEDFAAIIDSQKDERVSKPLRPAERGQ